MIDLTDLGWDETRAEDFSPYRAEGLVPGRVSVQHRGAWDVLTEQGELRCDMPGRLVFEASSKAELPAVGDWVAVQPRDDGRAGSIRGLLPRRTKFSRMAAHDPGSEVTEEQVLATNVDVVFVVMSLNEDISLRRLERYLTLGWESGAQPVVLLTKADLHPHPETVAVEVETVGPGVPVLVVSVRTGAGLDEMPRHLRPGTTAVFLGSSGVGKSTLVNTLAGEELFATQEIRRDGKGRHTTTRRELVVLPGGGIVIDTPGMRELQLWRADEGLDEAFSDIHELAAQCRFSDCAHEAEPGCAVQAALADGSLDADRWESFRKLERELEALERRLDKRAQAETRRGYRTLNRAMRRDRQERGRE